MLVVVSAQGVRLDEVRDFARFEVRLPPGVDLEEALLLAGAGRPAGEDVFVSARWIRGAMAEREDDDEEWLTGFEAMLGLARAQGWVDAEGDGIRAHVVKTP
jgi:hypothetical protein